MIFQYYDMVQLNLNLKNTRARKIDDVKPTMHSSRVHTRCVHDACVHVRNAHAKFGLHVHANCKPRTAE